MSAEYSQALIAAAGLLLLSSLELVVLSPTAREAGPQPGEHHSKRETLREKC